MFSNGTFQELVLPTLITCYMYTFTNDEAFFIPNPKPDDSFHAEILFEAVMNLYDIAKEARERMGQWPPVVVMQKYQEIQDKMEDILADDYYTRAMKRRSIAFYWCRCIYLTSIIQHRLNNPFLEYAISPIQFKLSETTEIITSLIKEFEKLKEEIEDKNSFISMDETKKVWRTLSMFTRTRHLDVGQGFTKEQRKQLSTIYELVSMLEKYSETNEELAKIIKAEPIIPTPLQLDTALELRRSQKNLLFERKTERLIIQAIGGVHVFNKGVYCYIFSKMGCFLITTYKCGQEESNLDRYISL